MTNRPDTELWRKYEDNCLNQGLSENRIDKLKQMFETVSKGLDYKSLETAERNDIEVFINKLNRNEFKKRNGGNYSGHSKVDMKKFIKQFWKWLKGENETYPKEVSWIKGRISKDEKKIPENVLSYQDVLKLANHMDKVEYRAAVLILFDSGFRIGELRSVTKKDITFEEYNEKNKCFWIKCNKSKTIVRKIPIPLFTEDIQNFVNSAYFRGLSDNDLIWTKSENAFSQYLKYNAEKSINRNDVHPHLFRHSAATYWAKESEGNVFAMAHRFGWSPNSKELATYVRMSGVFEKASVKKVYENTNSNLQSRINMLEKEINELKKHIVKNDLKTLLKEDIKRLIQSELKNHLKTT